jgi:hypothetical protein
MGVDMRANILESECSGLSRSQWVILDPRNSTWLLHVSTFKGHFDTLLDSSHFGHQPKRHLISQVAIDNCLPISPHVIEPLFLGFQKISRAPALTTWELLLILVKDTMTLPKTTIIL